MLGKKQYCLFLFHSQAFKKLNVRQYCLFVMTKKNLCWFSFKFIRWWLSRLNDIPVHFLMYRMRTQRAAGCCSARRIWSPCFPSFRSSSCIHKCWGLICRVRKSLCICWLFVLFHSIYWPAITFLSHQACTSPQSNQVKKPCVFLALLPLSLRLWLWDYRPTTGHGTDS